MKIVLDPGEKVVITFSDCDGEITVDRPNESVVSVSADLPDLQGRVGEIYREDGRVERPGEGRVVLPPEFDIENMDGDPSEVVFHPVDSPPMQSYPCAIKCDFDAKGDTVLRLCQVCGGPNPAFIEVLEEATEADLQRLEVKSGDSPSFDLESFKTGERKARWAVPDNYDSPPQRGVKEEDY